MTNITPANQALTYKHLKFLFYCLFLLILTANTTTANEAKLQQNTAVYSADSLGTAWALSQRHVVTNYHVIDGLSNLKLVTEKHKKIPVELILADEKNDIAILRITDKKSRLPSLPLAKTEPRLGSQVFTVGFPHPNLMGTSPKLTSGFINATKGLADDPRTYQVSVPIQSGNSGGPLLNMRGEVIGIITSKLSAKKMFEWTGDFPQNVNYAIKINLLNNLLRKKEISANNNSIGSTVDLNLETLADKVIHSVIIVSGDNKIAKLKQGLFSDEKHNTPSKDKPGKRIMLYSFAEPGNYDLSEKISGSDTIASYSKNTVNILNQQLKRHMGDKNKYFARSGEYIYELYYRMDKPIVRKSICTDNNAHYLVFSNSEKEPGAPFRHVTYRLIDCETTKEFKKEYSIERDELNDSFGYEVALHTTFKDFLLKVPTFINLVD